MVNDLQENEDIGPSSNIPSASSPSIRSKINLDDLPSEIPLIDHLFVGNQGGREAFVSGGFCNWSKPDALKEHVGEVNSAHNKVMQKCGYLWNQKRSYEANLICKSNPDIGKYCLGKAKKNNKLTAPSIQKEIIDCFAKEVTKKLCEEIKDDVFGLLADESSDVSQKEQMAVVLRYVDKRGVVKESLIRVAHVRGQGYDGASNMRGKFN
ncbi:uncharacterized protein LOC143621953 [Bidens hawaiensis]|uniref:uncharacterized protein LOC143621953 n=1 Tax=Bidens hawaiensis TaxID=980011 RepID=UPI00404B0E45